MSGIVILGGSAAGLLTGMQLAGYGHAVTVLEREPRAAVAPPAATPAAPRKGAPHAVQGHGVLSRAAVEIRRALPAVYAALLGAGVGELDLVTRMPVTISDRTPRVGDEDLVLLTVRRHTLDRVLVEAAETTPRLDLRFGIAAAGLTLVRDDRNPPRVTGVQFAGGEVLSADLVIDASGRRTPVPRWLAALGIPLPLEAWDCGLVYYTRHYRVRPDGVRPPLNRIFAAGGLLPSLNIGWFPGDNDTAMLAQTVLAEDALLKRVQHAACFEMVARAVPTVSAWLECAEPLTPVFGMGALRNTLRRVVQEGRPLVLGLHLVGDAACTTNPTLGRGLSFAAAAATGLARIIAEQPDDAGAQALLFEAFVVREIEPRFRENAQYDRALVGRLRADLAGQPPPDSPPPAEEALRPEELLLSGMADPDLYRTAMRYGQLLAGSTLLRDPALVSQVRRLIPPGTRLPTPAGPTRADLARILAVS
jgi:2-polyprenyl-6-methoxyphenol hydroxylase-like FAD-dependent oxidoreductase